LTSPVILLIILILAVAFFIFLFPIIAVSPNCRNPGCGGPEYESLSYVLTGVGTTRFFVIPNPPYGQVAVAFSILLPATIGLGIFTIVWQLRREKQPVTPK
jgi:hypothetical protein